MTIVTKAKLAALLARDDKRMATIGRALIVVFKNQTQEERSDNTTRVHNLRGFTPADARQGCISAKYYIKHGRLEDWMIEKWMKPGKNGTPRIAKYWRQLDVEAQRIREEVAKYAEAC